MLFFSLFISSWLFMVNAIKVVFPRSKSIRSNGKEKCYILRNCTGKQVGYVCSLFTVFLFPPAVKLGAAAVALITMLCEFQ